MVQNTRGIGWSKLYNGSVLRVRPVPPVSIGDKLEMEVEVLLELIGDARGKLQNPCPPRGAKVCGVLKLHPPIPSSIHCIAIPASGQSFPVDSQRASRTAQLRDEPVPPPLARYYLIIT